LTRTVALDVAEVAVAVTMGYLRVFAEIANTPVQRYAATLFNEVFELEA
jgi:hypothetical protein